MKTCLACGCVLLLFSAVSAEEPRKADTAKDANVPAVVAEPAPPAPAKSAPPAAKLDIRQKLERIVVPEVKFEDAKVSEVFRHLAHLSRKLDPEGSGINIFVNLPKDTDEPRVTMVLDNIPIGEVIKYVCMATGLNQRVDRHAVVVTPPR